MCLLLGSAAGCLLGHTRKGPTLLSWRWRCIPSCGSFGLCPAEQSLVSAMASRHAVSPALKPQDGTTLGIYELQTFRWWVWDMSALWCHGLRAQDTVRLASLFCHSKARAFNTWHLTRLWHTHASTVSQLNVSSRTWRNSPGALWCPSSPPSPEVIKLPPWNTEFVPWPGTAVNIWGWTGLSPSGEQWLVGSVCATMTHVTAAHLCAPAHLFQGHSYCCFTFADRIIQNLSGLTCGGERGTLDTTEALSVTRLLLYIWIWLSYHR